MMAIALLIPAGVAVHALDRTTYPGAFISGAYSRKPAPKQCNWHFRTRGSAAP